MTLQNGIVGNRKEKSCPDPDAVHVCAASYLMSDWSRELGVTRCWTIYVLEECQTVRISSTQITALPSCLFEGSTSFSDGYRVYKPFKKGEPKYFSSVLGNNW